jgi:hypothetical protein
VGAVEQVEMAEILVLLTAAAAALAISGIGATELDMLVAVAEDLRPKDYLARQALGEAEAVVTAFSGDRLHFMVAVVVEQEDLLTQ